MVEVLPMYLIFFMACGKWSVLCYSTGVTRSD